MEVPSPHSNLENNSLPPVGNNDVTAGGYVEVDMHHVQDYLPTYLTYLETVRYFAVYTLEHPRSALKQINVGIASIGTSKLLCLEIDWSTISTQALRQLQHLKPRSRSNLA
jgi:hypothetical protein